MIEDRSETQQDWPQEKLILPAFPPETPFPRPEVGVPGYAAPETGAYREIRPGPIGQRARATRPYPHARSGFLISKDPAYLFLLVALVVALISALIFALFAGSAVAQLISPAPQNNNASPGAQAPGRKATLHPTSPTPSSAQGSTASTLPPTSTPATVVASPTATSQPQSGASGAISLQITAIPQRVVNDTFVPVSVAANQPGVSVRLVVLYNVLPFFYSSAAQITNGNGNANLLWQVRIFAHTGAITYARVTAVTRNQDGQQVTSPTITVQVTNGA